jgi:hypothetical protein
MKCLQFILLPCLGRRRRFIGQTCSLRCTTACPLRLLKPAAVSEILFSFLPLTFIVPRIGGTDQPFSWHLHIFSLC